MPHATLPPVMASPPASGDSIGVNLFGMDLRGLTERMRAYGVPEFHAAQLYRWLYARRELDVESWTDLPRGLRARLAREAVVDPGRVGRRAVARDGTVKYGIELTGGGSVEAVSMTQDGRRTLCVSSQVGCALGCDFCLTAKMGLVRHLTPGEIVGQVALFRRETEPSDRSFNIVFMGMGEPLHNYDSVLAAFRLLTDASGFGISRKRVTVSTAGLAPAIERLARESERPGLAVSLNATIDEVRSRIMPVNRKYPLPRLLDACRFFTRATGDTLTLEYVLLSGVNESAEDIGRLAKIVRRLPAKLNLIPFNPVPGWLAYRPPSRRRVIAIRDELLRARVPVSIRWSRGAAARAACGQLALLPDSPASGGSQS